jgi:YVTN family beta-propeller protein
VIALGSSDGIMPPASASTFTPPTVITTVPVGDFPAGIGVNEKTNTLYVASGVGVTVLDGSTNTVVGSPIPTGVAPSGVVVNEQTNRIYMSNFGSGTMSVINGKTKLVIVTVPVGSGEPQPPGCQPFVTCTTTGSRPAGMPYGKTPIRSM